MDLFPGQSWLCIYEVENILLLMLFAFSVQWNRICIYVYTRGKCIYKNWGIYVLMLASSCICHTLSEYWEFIYFKVQTGLSNDKWIFTIYLFYLICYLFQGTVFVILLLHSKLSNSQHKCSSSDTWMENVITWYGTEPTETAR